MSKNLPPSERKRSEPNWLYYSGLAFQMLAIILLGWGIGYWIDTKNTSGQTYYAGIFALIFTLIALIHIIRELIRKS